MLIIAAVARPLGHAASDEPAQQAPEQPRELPPTAQSSAQIDLTGYWVSVVTEDWRYRMITAPRGDIGSVPASDEARKRAKEWDLAKDVQDGQ